MSAALEFSCSCRVYGAVDAAWWEALAADRAYRYVRAVVACPRRPRPAAPCGPRAAWGMGLPGASGSAWAGQAAHGSRLPVGSPDMMMMMRRDAKRQKVDSGAPLPGMPNVGFRVPADPLGSNTGVRTEISPSTYLYLAASLGSKQSKEQQ